MKKTLNTIKNYFLNEIVLVLLLPGLFSHANAQTATGLNFDGVDDRCTINDNAAYDLGTGNFTIEAWIKANSVQSFTFPTILSNRETGNVNSGLLVFLSGGKLTLQMDGINVPAVGNDLRDNNCHHIAIVRNGSTIYFYIDGVGQTAHCCHSQNINAAHPFWIGRDDPASTTTPFKGWIHEVRFWNVVRNQTQIQASKIIFLTGSETGLIGYWRMNEGSGQTINDLSPTQNNGFLGTINTTDSADPLYVSNSCMCPNPVISSNGGAVCTGQTPLLSTPSVAGYTYQWKLNGSNISGATNATYTAVVAGTYSCVATAFGCSGTSNSITLLGGAPPATISAGGPTTFCSGSSVLLSANSGIVLSYQWKLNGGNIGGATSLSYSAIASGSYTCVVTNNCGSSTSNAIVVTVNPTPTASISAGGPISFCTGGSVLLTAASGAGYTYQWKANGFNIGGATSQTYTATASGNFTCLVTAGSCSATSKTIPVTVDPPLSPSITYTGWGGFCPSTTVGLEELTSSGSFQWFEGTYAIPGATLWRLDVGHNANYSVNVTNACGTYSSAPYQVTDFIGWPGGFDPYITISYTGSLNICTGGSVFLYINSPSFYFDPVYQWYKNGVAISGANNTNYTATTAGDYACAVYDNNWWVPCTGPVVFSNFITATTGTGTAPTVTISAGGPITFCGSGSVTLNSSVNTSVTYQWKKNNVNISGATSASYLANTAGTYTCVVTNSCGSSTSNSIVVTFQTLTVTISTSTPNICTGTSAVIAASFQAGNSYQWKLNGTNISGATNSTYSATAGGSYTCMITNLCGSTTSSAIVMTLRPLPTAVISGTQTICSGNSASISINFTGTANWYGYYYAGPFLTFYNTSSDPYTINVSPTITTTYTLYSYVHDAYCYGTFSGSAVVTVQSSATATITPAGSTTFCSGGVVVLYANTGTGLSYQWKRDGINITGATGSSLAASTAGSYTVVVTNACSSATSAATVVTVNPLPPANITAGGPTTFCSGGSVTLNAVVAANRTYQWKKNSVNISGATASSYVANTSGTYKVTVTNTVTGCSKTTGTGVVVTKNPLPPATISPSGTITFCAGQSALLTANSGAGYTYKWKKDGSYIGGATAITYTVTTAGKYRVEVTNSNGCSKTSNADTVNVPCKEGENSIESATVFDMTIYPNPSPGVFTIQLSKKPSAPVTIEITDVIGKVVDRFVVNDETVILDKSNLVPGVYYLAARNKEIMLVKKLVIQ